MALTKMYPADFIEDEMYDLDYLAQVVGFPAMEADSGILFFNGEAYKDDNNQVVVILYATFRSGHKAPFKLQPFPSIKEAFTYVAAHYKELANQDWRSLMQKEVIQ